MALPRVLVTGASGFIGRHLLEVLKEKYEVIGLGRRSQERCGAPIHDNISWHQVDIGDTVNMDRVFGTIQAGGPVDFVIHLAAHYDFTGNNDPEYERTNVHGLRTVLDRCRILKPRCFVFSSSVAACAFPEPGQVLTESSPPDGDHVYARTKAVGEAMLAEYSNDFPSVIVRFAALFSDWCEYPPLYMFIRTWLSNAWNCRILGGKGNSAIPYLHIKDATGFLQQVLRRHADLDDGEILIASPDGADRHNELYKVATTYMFEKPRSPIHTPKSLVKPGIWMRNFFGRFTPEKPFEKPWMAKYVDLELTVDASRTRERLGWAPKLRREIKYRLPFLIENRKFDRIEWMRRNREAMKTVKVRPNLIIHNLLQNHKEAIIASCTQALKQQFPSYKGLDDRDHRWNHTLILGNLFNAIRSRTKLDFMLYCSSLARRRQEEGFDVAEVIGALETINTICIDTLMSDPESENVRSQLFAHVTMTIRFGIDQIQETYDQLQENGVS